MAIKWENKLWFHCHWLQWRHSKGLGGLNYILWGYEGRKFWSSTL